MIWFFVYLLVFFAFAWIVVKAFSKNEKVTQVIRIDSVTGEETTEIHKEVHSGAGKRAAQVTLWVFIGAPAALLAIVFLHEPSDTSASTKQASKHITPTGVMQTARHITPDTSYCKAAAKKVAQIFKASTEDIALTIAGNDPRLIELASSKWGLTRKKFEIAEAAGIELEFSLDSYTEDTNFRDRCMKNFK